MVRRSLARSLACAAAAAALGCYGAAPEGLDPASDPACQLDAVGEKSPGYPFDVEVFTNDVMPIVASSCGVSGCHGAPAGNGGFTVWAAAQPGDCDFGRTFNSLVAEIDLAAPANSPMLAAITGGSATHPFRFPDTSADLAALTEFAEAAAALYAADGGGVTPPPGPSPFDVAVFTSIIQPALDQAGCATGACHAPGGSGSTLFALSPSPSAQADVDANFVAVSSRANLASPSSSTIYVRSTVRHAAGNSTLMTPEAAAALLSWIEDARQNAGSNGNPTCAPLNRFNLGVFRSEILPILSGTLDLNAVDGQGRGGGCAAGPCHGTDRGPGTLVLQLSQGDEAMLQNFACFVNLAAPSTSEILLCPLNDPRCRRYPHPGQDVLAGANDLNYQRLLAYVFGSKTDVSPHDFAFFVRKINPIFNDVNAVQAGAQGRTCSDALGCHGVNVAGQAPANGSDFPIIPNASDLGRLSFNFVSATGFVNFLNPGESSLFLYPTNQIANRADHPFATGLPHPGGEDFAVDSEFARAILEWAAGLRPDAQGFQRNWLVAGDFAAGRISDPTLVNETTVAPTIFDLAGGAFNRGEWDGFFADQSEVDLNLAFPRAASTGRAGYAVSYAINTVPRQLVAQLVVSTNNPILIYVNGALVAQNDQGGGASALLTLPPSTSSPRPTRILIKLVQRPEDTDFSFSAQLRDDLGTLLTDQTGELVFTLGPNGGI